MAAPAKKSSARIPAKPVEAGPAGAVAPASKPAVTAPDARERSAMVAREAYFIAEKRGFAHGHALEDWIAAEQLVAARFAR